MKTGTQTTRIWKSSPIELDKLDALIHSSNLLLIQKCCIFIFSAYSLHREYSNLFQKRKKENMQENWKLFINEVEVYKKKCIKPLHPQQRKNIE